MRKFVKWGIVLLSHSLVAGVAALAVFIYDRVPDTIGGCVVERRTVSGNSRGDEVEMAQDICGGLAYSDTVTLSLVPHGRQDRLAFFSYERDNSEPVLHWLRDDVLTVGIHDTGAIYVKLSRIEGIQVVYR